MNISRDLNAFGYLKSIKIFPTEYLFTSGRQFLRLMGILEMMIFIFGCIQFILYFTNIITANHWNVSKDVYWTRYISAITFFLTTPTRTFLLVKGWHESPSKPTKYLRFYYKSFYLTIVPLVLLVLYGRGDIFQQKDWIAVNYIGVTLHMIFLAVIIWSACRLRIDINTLASPLMQQFRDHIQHMKENERSLLNKSELKASLTENNLFSSKTTSISNNEFPLVNFELIENHIISPLDIALKGQSQIGEGEFGIVHKGLLVRKEMEIEIAIKKSKHPENPKTFEIILEEMKVMIHVGDHPNIVKFYGVTADTRLKDHFGIINEYCSKGSLREYLHVNNTLSESDNIRILMDSKSSLQLKDLYRFALQICLGMDHLALKKVIHGDIASRNILLTDNLTVKITDFGLSRRLYNYQMYSRLNHGEVAVPWRWVPVEVLEDLKFSEKSDVWSFGITIWEIFTMGDLPYRELKWCSEISSKIREGVRLPIPILGNADIYQVMQDCWLIDASQRPTFSELKGKLKLIFENCPSLI